MPSRLEVPLVGDVQGWASVMAVNERLAQVPPEQG